MGYYGWLCIRPPRIAALDMMSYQRQTTIYVHWTLSCIDNMSAIAWERCRSMMELDMAVLCARRLHRHNSAVQQRTLDTIQPDRLHRHNSACPTVTDVLNGADG